MSKVGRLLVALLLPVLLSSCGRDCPVCPADQDDQETPPYRGWLYYVDLREECADLYMMDMETDSIVDSLLYDAPFFGPTGAIGVSEDGLYLAIGYYNPGATAKLTRIYDAQTLEFVTEVSHCFLPLFDVEDGILIRAGGDAITLYQIPSFSPVFEEVLPFPFFGKCVDRRRNLIYGLSEDFRIYTYDYGNRKLGDSIHIVPRPGDTCGILPFCLDPEGTRIFYRGYSNVDRHMGCYDIASREVLYTVPTMSYFGAIAVSPDGEEIYMTDPGDPDSWWNSGTIYIFDALTGHYKQGISLYGYSAEPMEAVNGTHIVFSPAGDRAYVASGAFVKNYVWGRGTLVILDTRRREVVKVISPEFDHVPFGPVIGPKR